MSKQAVGGSEDMSFKIVDPDIPRLGGDVDKTFPSWRFAEGTRY